MNVNIHESTFNLNDVQLKDIKNYFTLAKSSIQNTEKSVLVCELRSENSEKTSIAANFDQVNEASYPRRKVPKNKTFTLRINFKRNGFDPISLCMGMFQEHDQNSGIVFCRDRYLVTA